MLPHLEPRVDQERHLRESVTSLCEHVHESGDWHLRIGDILKNAFAECFGATFREEGLSPEETMLKKQLLKEKYCRPCDDE